MSVLLVDVWRVLQVALCRCLLSVVVCGMLPDVLSCPFCGVVV